MSTVLYLVYDSFYCWVSFTMCFADLELEFETVDTGKKGIHCIRVRYVSIGVQPLVLFVCVMLYGL